MSSPAIDGTNYAAARTHPMALPITTGFAATSLTPGWYWIISSTDGYLKQGGDAVVATVPATRAPAAAMPDVNSTTHLPAGVPIAIRVPENDPYISGIATSIAGTIVIVGPLVR